MEKKNRGPGEPGPRHIQTTELVPIAAAAATVLAVAAATTTAAAAERTLLTGPGDVDGERASINGLAVEGLDGLLGLFGRAHGDETEPAGTASGPVQHQVGFHDRAVRGERVLQVVFGGVEGKVSYEQFITHVM